MAGYYQKVLLKHFTPLVRSLGIHNLLRARYSGRGHILMLHRVVTPDSRLRIHNHLSLEISPLQLENTIHYFKRLHYDFIHISELHEWLNENRNTGRRFVIFTMDDGYKDNLLHAYPIFKKYGVPFTLYLVTSFPDNKAVLWWYLLEDVLLKNSSIRYNFRNAQVSLNCHSRIMKEYAFNAIRKIITQQDEYAAENEMSGFFQQYGLNPKEYGRELLLTWKEIVQLSDDNLVCIGAHTVNHPNLTTLSDLKADYEIAESKRIIERHIGKPVYHFSYPLGQYGSRETGYVSQCGFHTATTIKTANVFTEHMDLPFSLPRIPLNTLTTAKVLDLHTSGFFQVLMNGTSRIPSLSF